MKVPSNEIKLSIPFDIKQDQTTNLILDFDIPASVTREAGDYIFRPVIKVSEEDFECNRCVKIT